MIARLLFAVSILFALPALAAPPAIPPGPDIVARAAAAQAMLTPRLSPPIQMGQLGDSRSQQCDQSAIADSIRGHCFWASMLTGRRFQFAYANNFGVSGERSNQWLGRADAAFDTMRANGVKGVVVPDPINDRAAGSGITPAQSWANIAAIVAKAKQRGFFVITWMPTPKSSPNAFGAQTLAESMQYRALLIANAPAIGLLIANAMPDILDQTLAGYQAKATTQVDGLHWSEAGAYYVGKAEAVILNALAQPFDVLTWSSADVYDATYTPGGNLFVNSMMAGTGGGMTAGGATMSGTVANSWSGAATNAAGLTVTWSKVTVGNRTMQQAVLSGTPTATTGKVYLQQSFATGSYLAGDRIGSQAYVEVDTGCTGIAGLGIVQWIGDSGGSHSVRSGDGQQNVGYLPTGEGFNGVIGTTNPDTVGTSPTSGYIQLGLNFFQNVAVSCTFRAGNIEARKQ